MVGEPKSSNFKKRITPPDMLNIFTVVLALTEQEIIDCTKSSNCDALTGADNLACRSKCAQVPNGGVAAVNTNNACIAGCGADATCAAKCNADFTSASGSSSPGNTTGSLTNSTTNKYSSGNAVSVSSVVGALSFFVMQ